MTSRDLAETGDVRLVAIHAEHAFGDDEAPARLARARGKQLFKMVIVVMAEADLPDPRRSATMVQAGVDQPLGEDRRGLDVATAERGQYAGFPLPACGQDQGHPLALQPAQPFFAPPFVCTPSVS